MKLLYSPVARRLFLLAIMLSALFFMHPLQQTAYAATCCSVCDTNFDNCNANCDPSVPASCRICANTYRICSTHCTPGC